MFGADGMTREEQIDRVLSAWGTKPPTPTIRTMAAAAVDALAQPAENTADSTQAKGEEPEPVRALVA